MTSLTKQEYRQLIEVVHEYTEHARKVASVEDDLKAGKARMNELKKAINGVMKQKSIPLLKCDKFGVRFIISQRVGKRRPTKQDRMARLGALLCHDEYSRTNEAAMIQLGEQTLKDIAKPYDDKVTTQSFRVELLESIVGENEMVDLDQISL